MELEGQDGVLELLQRATSNADELAVQVQDLLALPETTAVAVPLEAPLTATQKAAVPLAVRAYAVALNGAILNLPIQSAPRSRSLWNPDLDTTSSDFDPRRFR